MDKMIPVRSLVVAALAVFVGPFVSWFVTKRQLTSSGVLADRQLHASLSVGNKQIIAPMRQAWINTLRDLLAELTSSALHYHVAGFEERTDEEYRRLTLLEQKVAMMLNPIEDDHKQLEQLIRKLISALERGREAQEGFPDLHQAVVTCRARFLSVNGTLLKRGSSSHNIGLETDLRTRSLRSLASCSA
jgi:hypothetical protein